MKDSPDPMAVRCDPGRRWRVFAPVGATTVSPADSSSGAQTGVAENLHDHPSGRDDVPWLGNRRVVTAVLRSHRTVRKPNRKLGALAHLAGRGQLRIVGLGDPPRNRQPQTETEIIITSARCVDAIQSVEDTFERRLRYHERTIGYRLRPRHQV